MLSTVIKRPEFVLYTFVIMKTKQRILQYLNELPHRKQIYKAVSYCICIPLKPYGTAFFITPVHICVSCKLFAFVYDSGAY